MNRNDPQEAEERVAERTRLVIARKARIDSAYHRGSILPGDCVRVTTGFTYIPGGPRTGYYRREKLVGYGPGHGAKAGEGYWPVGYVVPTPPTEGKT